MNGLVIGGRPRVQAPLNTVLAIRRFWRSVRLVCPMPQMKPESCDYYRTLIESLMLDVKPILGPESGRNKQGHVSSP